MRQTVCLLLALGLASSPVLAQQPIQESAKKAATALRLGPGQAATGDAGAQGQTASGHRAQFWTGAILGVAGGTVIVLGTTVLKSADTTSGNTPPGAYDSCVALKANPVYRGNQCELLKGPNTAVVVGGVAAAVAGATLMMLGSSMSTIDFGPGGVSLKHRVRF